MKNNKKNLMLSLIITLMAGVLVIASTSYALYTYNKKGSKENTLATSYLELILDDDSDLTFGDDNAYPIPDEFAENLNPYTFKIKNTGKGSLKYTITIIDDNEEIKKDGCENNLIDHSLINVFFTSNGYTLASGNLSDLENDLFTTIINPDEIENYELKIWISEKADNSVMGKHYHGKVSVKASYYNE